MNHSAEPSKKPREKDTRPRVYAAQIGALSTLEARRKALDTVPVHLRGMVQTYLRLAWELKRHAKTKKTQRADGDVLDSNK